MSFKHSIWRKHSIKGHLHQRGKRAGGPSGSRPRFPQWISLKELCGAVYTAAGPLCLRGGRPQRLLMERFFCGTRRNRERWLVGIYRSRIQCREMELQEKWNCARTRASVNTQPARKTLPAPAGGPAPRWCKCALNHDSIFTSLIAIPSSIIYSSHRCSKYKTLFQKWVND